MTKQISIDELIKLVEDEDVPEEDLAEYFILDTDSSGAFTPVMRANPRVVTGVTAEEGDMLIGIFNSGSRRKRKKRYRKKIESGWDGVRIVSEGDSWFQYPYKLKDIVDHLFDDYAIYSLGAAGDLLKDMIQEDEIDAAIASEHPQIVMLSGGGNDMVGDRRLATMLNPGEDQVPSDAPNQKFEAFLDEIDGYYRNLLTRFHDKYPDLKFIVHGYERAIPDNGKWLGKPMNSIRIETPVFQREIVAHLINLFNERMEKIEQDFSGVAFFADCRGSVADDQWHDELHPSNEGYWSASRRFAEKIEEAVR